MFVETINTIGTLSNAYEIGKKSQPLLGKLVRLVRDRKLNIVVCGAGGTGKSTLGKLLSGAFGREDILQPYQVSYRDEKLTLDSKTSGSILVLPGQDRFWGEELKKIANNQVDLLINVVSYGYHSIGPIEYQNLLGYQPGMTPREAIIPHRQGKLAIELELLRKLTPHLSIASKRKILMITLVTKQDLWWMNRNEVKKYYEQDDYAQIIQEVQRTLNPVNFSHEYFSASLLTENFGDDRGNILAPVAEGYDQKIQVVNFDRLLYYIESNLDLEIRR
jgi:hypothetical protein